jgi:methionine synthase I (cobalamin-dependent)
MPLLSAVALKRALEREGHVLADGGMGSLLIREGVTPTGILTANRSYPDKVLAVHHQYLNAGARVLTANTFGWRDGEPIGDFVREGALLAEQAAQQSSSPACVWLSLTTAFLRLEPLETLASLFAGRAIIIETCTTLHHAEEAVRKAKQANPTLLAVTCHYRAGGSMPDGTEPETAVRHLEALGVDVVGANCGENPESFLPIARRMKDSTGLPLVVQPSAGLPRDNTLGQWVYPVQTEAFVQSVLRLLEVGVKIVGGCCGTTPETIRAIYQHCFAGGE